MNIEGLFRSLEECLVALGRLSDLADRVMEWEERAFESGVSLSQALCAYETLNRAVEPIAVYAQLLLDLQGDDQEAEQLSAQIDARLIDIQLDTAFLQAGLQQMTREQRALCLQEAPDLRRFERYMEQVAAQPAVSAEVEEAVLELEGLKQSFGRIHRTLLAEDVQTPNAETADGETVEVTMHNFRALLARREDRAFRERVYGSVYGQLAQFSRTAAATYNGYAKAAQATATLSGHPSVLDAVLRRDRVEPDTVSQLIDAVRQHLPLYHRLTALQKRSLDVPVVRFYDLYVPVVPEAGLAFSKTEAQSILLRALAPLGTAYQQEAAKVMESVLDGGEELPLAYTVNVYDSQPYVLMGYQSNIWSLLVLAHEVGHALHMKIANAAQPYADAEVPLVASETAALVHELLVLRSLLQEAEHEAERKYVCYLLADKYRHTLFRNTMITEFERAAHQEIEQGGHLSGGWLTERFARLQAEYLGPDFAGDERSGLDWMRVLHLYDACYSYSYPVAFAAAAEVVERLLSEPEPSQWYLAFLAAGGSRSHGELMAMIGAAADGQSGYSQAFAAFEQCVDQLESMLTERL